MEKQGEFYTAHRVQINTIREDFNGDNHEARELLENMIQRAEQDTNYAAKFSEWLTNNKPQTVFLRDELARPVFNDTTKNPENTLMFHNSFMPIDSAQLRFKKAGAQGFSVNWYLEQCGYTTKKDGFKRTIYTDKGKEFYSRIPSDISFLICEALYCDTFGAGSIPEAVKLSEKDVKKAFKQLETAVEAESVSAKAVLLVRKYALCPFYDYKLFYTDGDTEAVQIRLTPKAAEEYYTGQSFGYWDAATNTEKQQTVKRIQEIK